MKNLMFKESLKKTKFLRYLYFSLFKKLRRKYLMLLKTERYIQVGLYFKKKKKISKFLLYKTLAFNSFFSNSNYKVSDYFYWLCGMKKHKDSSLLNLNKIKKVSIDDSFYANKVAFMRTLVPVFLTKFKYNLYDTNYKFLRFFNYINLKKTNLLYMQFYDYNIYNSLYFLNLYNSLKNIIFIKLKNILLSYKLYLYLDKSYLFNLFSIIKNVKFFKFEINNYIKFKNGYSVNNKKIMDKYLIKNRMFRAGKFFYHFLEYMKNFMHRVHENNVFFNKFKHMKMNGNKCFFKITTLNIVDMNKFKGWFYIYNYIKKHAYLNFNENKNKNKVIFHFMKKYHYFYFYIIRFLYKIIYNLKFIFIDKVNFKKVLFLKILVYYILYNKWFKFKPFFRLIRRKKLKRWKIKRIFRFKNLKYVNFLFRIKSKILLRNIVSSMRLQRVIKRRQRSTFFKYKNTIRIVNWLLKFRKLKSIKNPFHKFKKRWYKLKSNKMSNHKHHIKSSYKSKKVYNIKSNKTRKYFMLNVKGSKQKYL